MPRPIPDDPQPMHHAITAESPPVPIQVDGRLLFISPLRWMDYAHLDGTFGERFGRGDDGKPRISWDDFEGASFLHTEKLGIYSLLLVASRERDRDWSIDDIIALALDLSRRLDDPTDPTHEATVAEWDAAYAILFRVAFGGLAGWTVPAQPRSMYLRLAEAGWDADQLGEMAEVPVRRIVATLAATTDPVPPPADGPPGPVATHHNRVARYFGQN